MKRKSIFAVAAAVILLGVITAGAYSVISNWNPKMAEIFRADEQTQQKIIDDGMSQVLNLSTEDNGVTMEVLQTIADGNMIYVLMKFSSENEKLLEVESFSYETNKSVVQIEGYIGESLGSSQYWGMVHDSMETVIDENGNEIHQFYFFLMIDNNNNNHQDYNGREITINLQDMGAFTSKFDGMYTVIEGNWEVSWVLEYQDHTVLLEVNQPVQFGEYVTYLESIKISPVSMTVVLSGGELDRITEEFPFLMTAPIIDGVQLPYEAIGSGSSGWAGENFGESVYASCTFTRIIDVEKLTGVFLRFPDGEFEGVVVAIN
ncbi:MAG: DUF4179 domain-containing protein [Oscillospiraceae bacterium]|nr:DUF4179 domain-containing protein [Oscillospiraceae bacterium]